MKQLLQSIRYFGLKTFRVDVTERCIETPAGIRSESGIWFVPVPPPFFRPELDSGSAGINDLDSLTNNLDILVPT